MASKLDNKSINDVRENINKNKSEIREKARKIEFILNIQDKTAVNRFKKLI